MKAHFEPLVGLIRVGPECTGPNSPWDFSAVVVASEGVAEVKALANPDGLHKFTTAHFRAGKAALEALGFTVKWLRVGA